MLQYSEVKARNAGAWPHVVRLKWKRLPRILSDEAVNGLLKKNADVENMIPPRVEGLPAYLS